MLMNNITVPLFPLYTVLFPGGILPLRIFEPRYLDMVSRCLRDDSGFGVCLIYEGNEVDHQAQTHEVGTLAKIVNWDKRPDGLLGIDAQGQDRFQLLERRTLPNQLIEAVIELMPQPDDVPLPREFSELADVLKRILAQLDQAHSQFLTPDYHSATWVGNRLSEILPIPLHQRQYLLELDDPLQRLTLLKELLGLMKMKF
jgi:Lon protease-like protein